MHVVVQQPQLLPWVGLWYKVISADMYVLYQGVKFDQTDHQHRVTIDGSWLTLPIEKHQRNALIKDVKLVDDAHARRKLVDRIIQTCMGKKMRFGARLGGIVSILENSTHKFMVDLNQALFVEMIDVLGIKIDLRVDNDDRSDMGKIEKLDACLAQYCGDKQFRYLAGGGGLDYMGYTSLTEPVETWFQKMKPGADPNSLLQLIARDEHPLVTVKACANWVTKEGRQREWDGRPAPVADTGPAL